MIYHISAELVKVVSCQHTGTCGYICLAKATGKSSWKDIVSWFIQNKSSPFISFAAKDKITKLESAMEESQWNATSLPPHLYLDDTLLQVFATGNNVQIIVFQASENEAHYNALDYFESTKPNGYSGITISLLLHGSQNNMFELLAVVNPAKEEQLEVALKTVCSTMRKKKETFRIECSPLSSFNNSGCLSGAPQHTSPTKEEDGHNSDSESVTSEESMFQNYNNEVTSPHKEGDKSTDTTLWTSKDGADIGTHLSDDYGDDNGYDDDEEDEEDEKEILSQFEGDRPATPTLPSLVVNKHDMFDCDFDNCKGEIYDKCTDCGMSFCEWHASAHGCREKSLLTALDENVISIENDMFAYSSSPLFTDKDVQEVQIGGNLRTFSRADIPFVSNQMLNQALIFEDKDPRYALPLIYYYKPKGAVQTKTRVMISHCIYRNVQTQEKVLMLAVLQAPCGKIHFLVHSDDRYYLFKRSSTAVDGLSLKRFRADLSVAVDVEESMRLLNIYLQEYGPYGRVSDCDDPRRKMAWQFDARRGAPLETKDPGAFLKFYCSEDEDGSETSRDKTDDSFEGTDCVEDTVDLATIDVQQDEELEKAKSWNMQPAYPQRNFPNASYAFNGKNAVSLLHKVSGEAFFYDCYSIKKAGKETLCIEFGQSIHIKRLAIYNSSGRFVFAGSLYLMSRKGSKMHHFIFDTDHKSVHTVPRSHIIKPLPDLDKSEYAVEAADLIKKVTHHATVHKCLPDLPRIHSSRDTVHAHVRFSKNNTLFCAEGGNYISTRKSPRKRKPVNYSDDEGSSAFDDIYSDGYSEPEASTVADSNTNKEERDDLSGQFVKQPESRWRKKRSSSRNSAKEPSGCTHRCFPSSAERSRSRSYSPAEHLFSSRQKQSPEDYHHHLQQTKRFRLSKSDERSRLCYHSPAGHHSLSRREQSLESFERGCSRSRSPAAHRSLSRRREQSLEYYYESRRSRSRSPAAHHRSLSRRREQSLEYYESRRSRSRSPAAHRSLSRRERLPEESNESRRSRSRSPAAHHRSLSRRREQSLRSNERSHSPPARDCSLLHSSTVCRANMQGECCNIKEKIVRNRACDFTMLSDESDRAGAIYHSQYRRTESNRRFDRDADGFSRVEVEQLLEISSQMEQIQRLQSEVNSHKRSSLVNKYLRRR